MLEEISLSHLGLEAAGTIQLLVDSRITKETDFESVPENAKKGILRLVGTSGSEVSRKLLEKPLARIHPLNGRAGNKIFFFVTEDWSIHFGSYNGPISVLHTIDGDKIIEAEEKITLMRSLKTNWKIKESGQDGFPEIFEVRCRPDFNRSGDQVKFKIRYSRFLFDGTRWKQKTREVEGFWEDEGTFPSETNFL